MLLYSRLLYLIFIEIALVHVKKVCLVSVLYDLRLVFWGLTALFNVWKVFVGNLTLNL